MDHKRIAAEFGERLAQGMTAHSLALEAARTCGSIQPCAVNLEPAFHLYDPGQTFVPVIPISNAKIVPQHIHAAADVVAATAWAVRQMLVPSADSVDWAQAEAVIARLAGCPSPVSFELHATNSSAAIYLSAPAEYINFAVDAWTAGYPEIAIIECADPARQIKVDGLVLYDLYSPAPYHRSIKTRPAVLPWRSFLQLASSLSDGEVLFAQVLFQPVQAPWQQNIAGILEAERALGSRAPLGRTPASLAKDLTESMFAVAVRVGSTNLGLASRLEAWTGLFIADGKPFCYRDLNDFLKVISAEEVVRMLRSRTTHTTGQLFTASELATFAHLPDTTNVGQVRLLALEGLPVPDALRQPGFLLGTYSGRGESVEVHLPVDQPNWGMWVPGSSRKGKSKFLIHKFVRLARAGRGVCLLDPHRTTAFDLLTVLDGIDPERVVFLDFDAAKPVAFNPFDQADAGSHGRMASEYVHSLKTLFGTEGYHRMTHIFGMVIAALFALKENLASLPALLSKSPAGDQLRHRVIRQARNPEVQRFWQDDYSKLGPEAFSPIITRLSPLLLDDQTLRTFSQRENRFDIAEAMDSGKAVIVAPPASPEAAAIICGVLIAQAKLAALRRAGSPRAALKFDLLIDEFHRFISSAAMLEGIINECAKGGLGVTLANQDTGQIPDDLLKAIFSMPNSCVFGVGLPDAKRLAPIFNGTVKPETLNRLGQGEVYARIGQDLVNFKTPAPLTSTDSDVAARIIAASAKYYADPTPTQPPVARRAPRIIDTLTEEEA